MFCGLVGHVCRSWETPLLPSSLLPCLFLYTFQFIEHRSESVSTAGHEDARFAAQEVSAAGEHHYVFLHVAPRPVGDAFRRVAGGFEILADLEVVTAAGRPIATAVGEFCDQLVVDGFLDDGDADFMWVHLV